MTLLISYRHDGFRFDTRKALLLVGQGKGYQREREGRNRGFSPLRFEGILGFSEFSSQIAIFLHLCQKWL